MYCRPVGQVIFANWLATTSAMSGKSPIHSSRRLVPGSRLVWTNPSCRVPFWVLRPVQTTAVLSSLASLRKCEDAERCSCSHRFWTLKSVGYLSEIPTTTVARHLSEMQLVGSRLVWTNPSCRVPFWVLRPVQTTAVLSSLASLRKCEDAERCSCSHRFWTLKSVSYLSEIPTTTVCASSI